MIFLPFSKESKTVSKRSKKFPKVSLTQPQSFLWFELEFFFNENAMYGTGLEHTKSKRI